jgi:hypothetical protein
MEFRGNPTQGFVPVKLRRIPENPCQLPDGPDPALCGGDVVDDGDGEDGVEALVSVGQRQVVAQQNLHTEI